VQIGANGDGKMSGSPENFQYAYVADVFEALTVHFEDLITSFESNFIGFGTLFHFGNEDAESALESTQDAEMKYFIATGPGQRHCPDLSFFRAGEIQHPQLLNQIFLKIFLNNCPNI
jgi:hypothetical protein